MPFEGFGILSGKRKVSPEDPRHLNEALGERRDNKVLFKGCFGARELHNVEYWYWQHQYGNPPISKEELEERVEAEFQSSLDTFIERAESEKHGTGAIEILSEVAYAPKVLEEIHSLTANYKRIPHIQEPASGVKRLMHAFLYGDQTAYKAAYDAENRLYTLIKERKIPRTFWFDLLKAHKENYIEATVRFEKHTLPRLKERFLAHTHKCVGTDVLPIPLERVTRTLARLHVGVHDGIWMSFADAGGLYAIQDYGVSIATAMLTNPRVAFEHVEQTFTHEMMHALSSRMVLEQPMERVDVRVATPPSTEVHRTGFSMHGNFEWLNEALTEYLAAQLVGAEPQAYQSEIRLLKHLMEKGREPIPLRLFSDAYFEDHEPASKTQTIPHWRALRKAINESFGSRLLTDLEKQIQKKGIDAVLKEYKVA